MAFQEPQQCPICLDSLNIETYSLQCKHTYCKKCITEWLKHHNTCPLCRSTIQPLQKYVDDGIMSNDRLQSILLIIAMALESLHPYMDGYTEHIETLLANEQMQTLITECSTNINRFVENHQHNSNNNFCTLL